MSLIKATANETADLTGQAGPADQSVYTCAPGIVHMYPEIVRLHIANTCSSHCRFCNQHRALSHPEEPLLSARAAATYVIKHRTLNMPIPLNEALLSGGDPLILPNTKLFEYFVSLAEAGIKTIRIGTKELAFFPHRFDGNWFDALDGFHSVYPDVRVNIFAHFSHPDEYLSGGNCTYETDNGLPRWRQPTGQVIENLLSRPFVTIFNQTPIIRSVNDDSAALHILQKTLTSKRVVNQYFFQCRPIKGYEWFSVPVETTNEIIRNSQIGLTSRETTARLIMATAIGKLEYFVGSQEVVFHLRRNPAGPPGSLIRAKRNPQAFWVSDYLDRIISDDTGKLGDFEGGLL